MEGELLKEPSIFT